jgi:hypothetical protein
MEKVERNILNNRKNYHRKTIFLYNSCELLKLHAYVENNSTEFLLKRNLYPISFTADIEKSILKNYCGAVHNFVGENEFDCVFTFDSSLISSSNNYEVVMFYGMPELLRVDMENRYLKLTY